MSSTMKAVFTRAVLYEVTAQCRTPLRTGGADGDPESILRDRQKRAFLQGTSLAGALRNWTERYAPSMTMQLFGGQDGSGKNPVLVTGHLIVSDAVFEKNADLYIRPRLQLDHFTGTASARSKFDMAHIGTGAKFSFTLTWLGTPEDERELSTVEQILGAINSGEIRLGAQKSNGFGQVSLTVTKRRYDMMKANDRNAWLKHSTAGREALKLPKAPASPWVRFTLAGHADNLLIRAASVEQSEEKSYTPNQSEGGRPLIPGSSIKGAVRTRAQVIAGTLGFPQSMTDSLFGRGASNDDNGIPGRIWFEDAVLDRSRTQKISRIRINKFTGGVIRGGLFTEEPVSGDVVLRIQAPEDPLACSLLLYALRDLGFGLYSLGSGGSIGRGYLNVQSIDIRDPKGRTAKLTFSKDHSCSLKDPDRLVKEWLQAWGGAIHDQ